LYVISFHPVGQAEFGQNGANVEYVRPHCFEKAYAALTSVCHNPASARAFIKLFIDGASGSGKTRLGWELFNEVQRKATRLKLKHVSYAMVDAEGPPLYGPVASQFSPEQAAAAVAQHLVQIYGVDCKKAVLGPSVSLSDVVEAMMPAESSAGELQRSALVLHVDEFQKSIASVLMLLAFIRLYNSRQPQVLILPVCTGFWVDPDIADEPGGEKRVIRLNYLQNSDETWMLVQRAASIFCTNKQQLLELLSAAWAQQPAPLLRYLVEDTLGWAIACVQLGAELALAFADQSGVSLQWNALQIVEMRVLRSLREYYSETVKDSMRRLSEAGLRKLAAMALSPFQACGVGGSGKGC
jgi:hypothetical protein